MKTLVEVTFGKNPKLYRYFTDLVLHEGATYNIVADNETTYSTPVTVVKIHRNYKYTYVDDYYRIREITHAHLVTMPKKPESKIKNVLFNKKNGITTVVWYDNKVTMVKCHPDDEFDKEKALALCFMKRVCDNRGCFNDELKKWCKEGKSKCE